MSKETETWLNQCCLIGFTDKRGHAWHYRESAQGIEPNHYPQAIPIADVQRRLFSWEPLKQPIYVKNINSFTGEYIAVPNRQAIVASDNGDVLGVFKDGYEPHRYDQWLLENVQSILDDDALGIGAALLLRNRGVAVVQVEVPDYFTTRDGVQFRPNLVAATSLDGSLSTTYKRTITDVVCDNTTEIALAEEGQQIKIKHSRYSGLRLGEAREALELIYDSADAFTAEVEKLCATTVTDQQWQSVLNALVPIPEEMGRSQTTATNKRATLTQLWVQDPRVEPWKNSAWGVHQAFNTWAQHFATVKGAHRAERNFDNVLSGKTAAGDSLVLRTLEGVLA